MTHSPCIKKFATKKIDRGFTLVELLVIISIIGILSSIVLASLSKVKNKGYDAQRVTDLSKIQAALDLYYNQNGYSYPPSAGSTWGSQCATWGSYAANNVIPGLVPAYLPKMPTDPQMDTVNNLCCYIYASNGTDYKFLAHNCPTSNVCYGSGEATGPFPDPVRATWSCAIYSSATSGNGW